MNKETSQSDTKLDGHQTFKIKTFLVIIDRLNVGRTKETNNCLCTSVWTFWFFFLVLGTNLTPSEVYKNAKKLQKYYHNKLASTFANECVHFGSFFINTTKWWVT